MTADCAVFQLLKSQWSFHQHEVLAYTPVPGGLEKNLDTSDRRFLLAAIEKRDEVSNDLGSHILFCEICAARTLTPTAA